MSLARLLINAVFVLLFAATSFATTPVLPVGLDFLNGYAAGQMGVAPVDCDVGVIPGPTLGHFDGEKVTIDLRDIAFRKRLTTPQAFGVAVLGVIMHEYMHVAGYGEEYAPKHEWEASDPPTAADCEHFHISTSMLNIYCDAAQAWQNPTTPEEHDILDEICGLFEGQRDSIETHRSKFTGCGVIPEKEFSGGFSIPAFDPASPAPQCSFC